ncbi:MAG: hypothetical protein HYZ22_19570 [Chloroflexi bacterium]|nr:hypothetical protein [Chloroflexota bacterium]
MDFLKKNITYIVILLVTALLIWGRLHWYGDLRLSIANGDTHTYISASHAPLFSWKMFTAERMFTTNLIYKIANDPIACPRMALSLPSTGKEKPREISPCFDKIALFQNLLAIFGWMFLALTTTKFLNNNLIKFFAATSILPNRQIIVGILPPSNPGRKREKYRQIRLGICVGRSDTERAAQF